MIFEPNLMMTSDGLRLYQGIKENMMRDRKSILEDRTKLNKPIVTTGPFAGYTALHVACMENNDDFVGLLVYLYKVNVNVVAEDGTQPIHLACFYEPVDDQLHSKERKLKILLDARANANAELDQEMFFTHVTDQEWCPDFGDKMKLSTYTVIYNKPFLTNCFAYFKADLFIMSPTNKTLVMYTTEKKQWFSTAFSSLNNRGPQYINHRDNEGIPATHYIFHPQKYGDYRYDARELIGSNIVDRHITMVQLLCAGADKYALLNNDPATFLPNLAAYRGCPKTLERILPFYTSMPLSKALYYATLPIDENSDNYFRIPGGEDNKYDEYLSALRKQREECIEVILKDLINRRTFGLSAPKSEEQLMDKLIATDTKLRNFVHNYQTDFIQGELKNKFIEVHDKKMTLYDFIMNVYDNRKIKLLARDKNLTAKLWNTFKVDSHRSAIHVKIINVRKRLELLKTFQKISTLRKAIPLPYEIVLDIIEYLNNYELEIFTKAFISP